jgi:hypothetical protein
MMEDTETIPPATTEGAAVDPPITQVLDAGNGSISGMAEAKG